MLTKVYSDEVQLVIVTTSIPESVLSAKISYNDLCEEACALGKPTFDNQFELLERVHQNVNYGTQMQLEMDYKHSSLIYKNIYVYLFINSCTRKIFYTLLETLMIR